MKKHKPPKTVEAAMKKAAREAYGFEPPKKFRNKKKYDRKIQKILFNKLVNG